MSRVDKPALKCDRCGTITEDLAEMSKFQTVEHHHMSGTEKWDLCPLCWLDFRSFITGGSL
jgi:hypothetical protein